MFSGDTRTLSCNDKEISKKEIAEEDLGKMIQLNVLTYDGAAMGGKTYFKNSASFCNLSTVAKNGEEVASLSCSF